MATKQESLGLPRVLRNQLDKRISSTTENKSLKVKSMGSFISNIVINLYNLKKLIDVAMLQIFTRGQFWPSGIVVACVCLSVCVSVCVYVHQPRACPRHKSPRVQARTTKFGQKVQNNLVKVPIILGGNWPWPSRWNLTWKAKFTPFWACPHHNSPSIQARTTKFGQKMQTNLLVVHIVLGGDWLRPSWSNLTR